MRAPGTVRLRHWEYVGRAILFYPAGGRARVIPADGPAGADEAVSGFAALERSVLGRRTAFAVFRTSDALLFHAGPRRWDLASPRLAFHHDRVLPFVSRFRVVENGRTALSFTYAHPFRRVLEAVDPTWDHIDREGAFFLDFVAMHAGDRDWQEGVWERWVPVEGGEGGA